jgi:hypothetical protein
MPNILKENLLTPEHLLPEPELELESPSVIDARHNYSTNQTKPGYTDSSHVLFDDDTPSPLEDLLVWKAPARPYQRKTRSFFTTAAVLVVLFSLLAFLLDAGLLAVALAGLLFVAVVLNYVPPEDIDYKVSTQGITVANRFYHWRELSSFWVTTKHDQPMLYIRTRYQFPPVLILLLGPLPVEQAKKVVAHFLPFQEIAPRSFVDDWSERLQRYFPLEVPKV